MSKGSAVLKLFIVALANITVCGGMFLAVPLTKLIGVLGTDRYLLVLCALTVGLGILALVDLERLSAAYRSVNRDLWFLFIKAAVLGFGGGICILWIVLFKMEILPLRYVWVLLVVGFVLALVLDRKERRPRYKKFRDVDELLRRHRKS